MNKDESSLKHIKMPKNLKNAFMYCLMASLVVLLISYLYSKIACTVVMAILSVLFLLRNKIAKTKTFKKIFLYFMYTELTAMSKSINQTQVLLAKQALNLPIEENESEVKTFCDVSYHFGNRFPYMKKVKNTRKEKVCVEGENVKCISSYSYLGLALDERVQEAAINAAKQYSAGNHGPRMLCGNLEILEELEVEISKFFQRDSALVFSSGYLACMSAIAGIVRKNDFLIMDKLCHASLKAGAKLSGAQPVYFKHNNFADAERLIQKKDKKRRLVMVIEGIYSMDGDIGNLEAARKLCDKYGGLLILDEAHSLGALGKTGKGTEEYFDYKYKADIICGSFTKSIASVGGYLTCSKDLREFYTFYAPGTVFSAPLSAYHAGAALKAFEIINNEPQLITKLQENAKYLRDKFIENKFNIGHSVSCVLPVIFHDPIHCVEIFNFLLKNGYFSSCVMAPACPVLEPRFRITATSAMTKGDMDYIVNIFIRARNEVKENKMFREIVEILN